jgi:hypothetical protein
MAIDNLTQTPFLCKTLPLPKSVTQNRDKVIRLTRERYLKPTTQKQEFDVPQEQ